jgi:hypothetical protein
MDEIQNGEDGYDNFTFAFRSREQGSEGVLPGHHPHSQAENLIPMLHDSSTKGGPYKPNYPPSRRDWEVHRERFTRLYQIEERELKEVMEIMKDRYLFRATYGSLSRRVMICSLLIA